MNNLRKAKSIRFKQMQKVIRIRKPTCRYGNSTSKIPGKSTYSNSNKNRNQNRLRVSRLCKNESPHSLSCWPQLTTLLATTSATIHTHTHDSVKLTVQLRWGCMPECCCESCYWGESVKVSSKRREYKGPKRRRNGSAKIKTNRCLRINSSKTKWKNTN